MAPFDEIIDAVYTPVFRDHTDVEKVDYEHAKECLTKCTEEVQTLMKEKYPGVVYKIALFEQQEFKQFIVMFMMHLDDGIRYMAQNFSWRDDVEAASPIVRVTQQEWH